MADTSNFAANYAHLVAHDAIPDIGHHHLSESVKEAISGLSADHLATLVDLAAKTKSHLFLHDKDNHVIAMGL